MKGSNSKGFGEYRSVGEWRTATFGNVRDTWDPTRKEGFGGYATKSDWHRATFPDSSRTSIQNPSAFRVDKQQPYEHKKRALFPADETPSQMLRDSGDAFENFVIQTLTNAGLFQFTSRNSDPYTCTVEVEKAALLNATRENAAPVLVGLHALHDLPGSDFTFRTEEQKHRIAIFTNVPLFGNNPPPSNKAGALILIQDTSIGAYGFSKHCITGDTSQPNEFLHKLALALEERSIIPKLPNAPRNNQQPEIKL